MNKELSLILTGDFMLSYEFLSYINRNKLLETFPFHLIKTYIQGDVIFSNLECSLFNKGHSIRPNSGPQLYSPPIETINVIKDLSVNVLSLSNNHIKDFGEVSICKTKNILEKNGINVFGAGENYFDANKELFIDKNGLKIGFLGYVAGCEGRISPDIGAVEASENNAGCVFLNLPHIKDDINRVKTKADLVFVSLHWGYELFEFPSPEQIELAHQIIDAGADIIIGHHAHILQGIEKYNDGLIFYNLGNFFFMNHKDYPQMPPETNEFIIAKCTVNRNGVKKLEIIPGILKKNYELVPYTKKNKQMAISQLKEISDKIKTENYHSFWNKYKNERERELSKLEFDSNYLILKQKFKKYGFIKSIQKLSLKFLFNNIKVILNMFKKQL